MRKFVLSAAFVALAAGVAWAAVPVKTVKTGIGDVLAGENGMTLYTFKKDTPGVSNCYDQCAVNWPPLIAAAGAAAEGDYSLVERKDGSKQWAKQGWPLYYWIKDVKEGDTTGDGVGGNWEAARP
jgi:predicted lipoprotein with Yx(FWY)xxD motif